MLRRRGRLGRFGWWRRLGRFGWWRRLRCFGRRGRLFELKDYFRRNFAIELNVLLCGEVSVEPRGEPMSARFNFFERVRCLSAGTSI